MPSSQKSDVCPIAFVLDDGQGGLATFTFNIRPEDLTKSDPSRLTVQQTLGNSAFVDNFGPGLADIVISGHTGWRGNTLGDGITLFETLKATVYDQWHAARDQARQSGQDPNDVTLVFADTLNSIAVVVVPRQFVLKRSRVRPLLMMYQIQMTVIADLSDSEADNGEDGAGGGDNGDFGGEDNGAYESLGNSSETLSGMDVGDAITGDLLDPMNNLMGVLNLTMSNLLAVLQGAGAVLTAGEAGMISLAVDLAVAGRNAFYTVNAIQAPTNLGAQVLLMQAASACDNISCVLSNAFKSLTPYPDYSGLYGSSNCSSTSGGSPISPLLGQNAFEVITQLPTPAVAISVDAQSAIDTLKVCDPVQRPPDADEMVALLGMIANGVTFP